MITAIILAAGTSSRYGQANKLLLPFGESVVVRETVRAVLNAGVLNPVVVTGHQCEQVAAALSGLPIQRAHNPNYRVGEMLSSIQTGLRHLMAQADQKDQKIEATFIVLGDQPLMPSPLLCRLSQAFHQQCAEIIAPRFDGVRGHPVLISRKWWDEALELQPGQNLRDLLKAHPAAVAFLQVNNDIVLRDVDTPQAYAEALALARTMEKRLKLSAIPMAALGALYTMHLHFDDETRAFLELPLLMRLGTIGPDGFPQVTPVWYIFEEGRFITSTQKARVKYRNILRDPHVGASIDWESRPYRGLSLRGIAHLREDNIEALVERICARYVPAEELAEMVQWVLTGQRVLIEIQPVSLTKVGAGWRGM